MILVFADREEELGHAERGEKEGKRERGKEGKRERDRETERERERLGQVRVRACVRACACRGCVPNAFALAT